MAKQTVDMQFYDELVNKLSDILASDQTDLQEKKTQMMTLLTTAKRGRQKKSIDLFFIHFCVVTICFLIRNSKSELEQQFGQMIGITFMSQLFAGSVAKTNIQENATDIMPLINRLAGALIGMSLTAFSTKATPDDIFVLAYEVICDKYLNEVQNRIGYLIDMLLCSLMQYEATMNQIVTTMNRLIEEQKQQVPEPAKHVIENKNTIKKTKDGHTIQ